MAISRPRPQVMRLSDAAARRIEVTLPEGLRDLNSE